jgi:hypothetical protein
MIPPTDLLRLARLREREAEAARDIPNRFEAGKVRAAARAQQGKEREDLERQPRPASVIGDAYDPAPAEAALDDFIRTGNPIYAMAAIRAWGNRPLPPELRNYLSEAFDPIVRDAIAVIEGTMTAEAARQAIPGHLGLAGNRGAGSGAFADLRRLTAPDEVDQFAAAWNEKRGASDANNNVLAYELGYSTHQARRLLTEANRRGLITATKPRTKLRRKKN